MAKKVLILQGSPRKNGNTQTLVEAFTPVLTAQGCEVREIWLYDLDLKPCLACRTCQKDWTSFHCAREDDMQQVFDALLRADLIVFATPIYAWYCTAPMKAVLDRMVYGMNKFYGREKGPALWAGKDVALISTCGYSPEKGSGLWEEGVKRVAKHSGLRYRGLLCERQKSYAVPFMDEEKRARAEAFAEGLLREAEA